MIDPGPSPAPRRPFARWIKIVLSLALLSVTAMLVGAKAIVARLHGLDRRWIGLAFAITVVQFALLGARWWFLARRLGLVVHGDAVVGAEQRPELPQKVNVCGGYSLLTDACSTSLTAVSGHSGKTRSVPCGGTI